MSQNFDFLRAFSDYWTLIGAKTVNRFGSALSQAENETYTFEKALGDVFGFYNDALGGWIGLASGSPPSPTPIVSLKGTKSSGKPAKATVALALGAMKVECTALVKVGSPGVKIKKSEVTATVTPPNLDIEVNLGTAAEGVYQGLVHQQAAPNAPVAQIMLTVLP